MKRAPLQEFVYYSGDRSVKLRVLARPAKILDVTPANSDIYAYRLNGNGYLLFAKRITGPKGRSLRPNVALTHFKDIVEA
jgi:hypothetical protein